MKTMVISDPVIIKKAHRLKESGLFVSDISKKLSEETGIRITQLSLWRLFTSTKIEKNDISELDYPSRKEIENIFSDLLQRENDLICTHGGEKLKRKIMIRILNTYIKKEFTYNEVRINLNTMINENVFLQHWNYLTAHNFIEKTENGKFKFCDRVKKWRNFGQI
jgi:hypothetical protein